MAEPDIQVVSNEAGEPTAVIVPIVLWREIASGRQTAYLLKSGGVRRRLLAALERGAGSGDSDRLFGSGYPAPVQPLSALRP